MPATVAETKDVVLAQTFQDCLDVARLAGRNNDLRLRALQKALFLASGVTECLAVHTETPEGSHLRWKALTMAADFERGRLERKV